MSTVTATAPSYEIDNGVRHLITAQNLVELGLTWDALQTFLAADGLKVDGQSPDGISINESIFGNYSGPNASTLGWMAYLNVGEPLIEERSNIIQPPADVLSTRVYANRSGETRSFKDAIKFTVSNTISWSLAGTAQLTFGGRASAELEEELQASLASSLANVTSTTHIDIHHPKGVGHDDESQTEQTVTTTTTETGTGSAKGTAAEFAQLLLGITGSVSGSLTTSWSSASSLSGDIAAANRVETMVTQRRQIRQFIYELPIDFAGYVALHYPNPVPVTDAPPQSPTPATSNVIAHNLAALGNLLPAGRPYRSLGIAETVSDLNVEHTVFATEPLAPVPDGLNIARPHYL
ncbi:hypothetical protein CXB49_16145 [Chromobacterium sp. ATCC 53434]|uniref:hypothetical protein n=1 Tax=Chromobacterium TaxID=535 RepID=UPI000C769A52|nr:hypothetical protein [Chromobacterium sp. ATCC 53434]AUH52234.1 hypothetical protein CXB49_16145 [Chromobacterium sp. ATCC 53434]